MGYKEIATPLAERGVPTIPLRPRTKIAFLSEWEENSTTSLGQIDAWDREYPEANGACVALAKLGSFWFFEVDKPEVIQRIESETNQKIPRTFRVRSSPGRGHFYWLQSAASLAMGNISQPFVKGGDWSARVDRQYVVAPGSLHPLTGLPYEIVSIAPIIEAPDWLIQWCLSQKQEKKNTQVTSDGPIISGGRNNTLTSIGGRMRNTGLEYSEIESALLRINQERCQPPLDESEVKTIAASVSRYAIPVEGTVLIGGKPAGSTSQFTISKDAGQVAALQPGIEIEERPTFEPVPYPKFPHWIMEDTSIYKGLCKPFCDKNSRYAEFMFMPAMTLLLNYIGTRVRIEMNDVKPSIFLVLIGRRGEVIKSSSVQDAITYFKFCGLADYGSIRLKNAEGKVLVWTVGSPEGLGIEMSRLNCKNGVLFYDELSMLTNKAGIESSTLTANLLTMYESGNFQNVIKAKKDCFDIEPGSYCASLIACSTDKNFRKHWSRLADSKSSGLEDRFFFLYQPEHLKERSPYIHVPTQEGSIETRKLIDKAVAQKIYKVTDYSPFAAASKMGNRIELRMEKFALGFAVDLGRDEIDEDCIERALRLVEYEQQVKKYLKTFEAFTKEGAIQMEIKNTLHRTVTGEMALRDLTRVLHADRYGTTVWNQSYIGLIRNGWIREEGTGVRSNPKRVVLLRVPDDDED